MKPTIAGALSLALALLIGGTGVAMAGGAPTKLSQAQLMMQTQETDVLNLLSAKGYQEVTKLQQNGGKYTAMVMKDGKQMQVTVDLKAGTVSSM
jgi:hypothetical protein